MAITTATDARETYSLIGSDKVEGTAVYGADSKKIGKVERIMLDKISGKTAYAVITFGGFMGIGEDYYPIPWATMKYDIELEGYRVNLTADKLKGAPKYSKQQSWDWTNRKNDQLVYDYYGAAPFWY
jgi:hypothetical protein